MRLLDEMEGTCSVSEAATDLVSLVRHRAQEHPDREAYVFMEKGEKASARLTYSRLDHQARCIAAHLQTVIPPGERALLLYPPSLAYIEAFFGCLYAGLVAVPAYPPTRQHLARLVAIVEDASPAIIMTTEDLAVRFRDHFECRGVSKAAGTACRWLATDTLASDDADSWYQTQLSANSLAFLQYTSGSTGDPKGVMVSHGNLLANQEAIKQSFGHSGASTVVGWLPLYHDMGLIGNILQPLYLGSKAVLMSPMAFLEKPARWLQAISDYGASTSGGPNFAYDLCVRKVDEEQKRGLDLSTWTLAFNGSEPVRAATMERFAEAFAGCGFRRESFFPCYGLAEATLFVSGRKLTTGREPENARGAVNCGRTVADHALRIVDPKTGMVCPAEQEGEIWISGPSVAQGYWNRPEASAEIFRARLQTPSRVARMERSGVRETDPATASDTASFIAGTVPEEVQGDETTYLRTGDLGFISDDGLHVTGRIKDLIIVRGRNYHPQDIEENLTTRLQALRPHCCAAFSVAREDEEAVVVVAEVTRDALRAKTYEPLIASMRRMLSEELDLAAAELLLVKPGSVPKTSSGKIRRSACRQACLNGTLPVLARTGGRPDAEGADGASDPGEPAQLSSMPEQLLLQEALRVLPEAQRSPLIARFLCAKAARLLGVAESDVARDLPLRSLGLDSLKAVEIKHAADQLLAVDAPLSWFLSDLSLAELAETLAADVQKAADAVSPAPDEADLPIVGTGPAEPIARESAEDARGRELSLSQRAMWSVHQMYQGSVAYNLHLALVIDGEVDVRALRRTLGVLVDRHGMLRTVYHAEADRAVQRVVPSTELPDYFAEVDATGWSHEALQHDLARRVGEPFDLTSGPLLRATLYRLPQAASAGRHVLLLCAHHIAVDLWSVLILVSELKRVYADLISGRSPTSAAPASRYADFVAWQRGYLESPASERDWDYWQRQLEGELPILALLADRPRRTAPTFRGASVALRLSPETRDSLKALAGRQGVTLFTLLLAAYKVLLYRHTWQKDLIVGVPTSGRSEGRFASVVGNFVNPLPLRSHPSGDRPFCVFLQEVKECLLGALEHQNFPFPLMVERLQPERSADHWPLYQTLFVLQQAQAGCDEALAPLALGEDEAPSSWGTWQVGPLGVRERVENFDLKLMAAESGRELLFSFQYRLDLFEPGTIHRLAHRFEALLKDIVARPDVPLGDLSLLPEGERQHLLAEWNATDEFDPAAAASDSAKGCLHRLFELQAARTPEAVAVVFGDRHLTYRQLNARSNRLAHALITAGAGQDTPVGICAYRSLEMVVGLLGILKAGCAYLPLDPDYPAERLSAMLEDAGAPLILAQTECLSAVTGLLISKKVKPQKPPLSLGEGWGEGDSTRALLSLRTVKGEIWSLDSGEVLQPSQHADCAGERGPTKWIDIAGGCEDNPDLPIHGETLAYALFTSGSTGRPKGVGIPHKGIGNRLRWMQDQFRLDDTDAVLQKTPFTFDVSVWELFWPLMAGARLVMAAPGDHKEPERLVDLIEGHGVTTMHFVPSMLGAFLDAADLGRCASLRRVICSGEALSAELCSRFHERSGAELHNLYGPTEASVDVTAHFCERDLPGKPVPIGRPIANTRVHLLDERLNPVPVGVAGELYIAGVQLARGYLGRPDLTAERFLPNPFPNLPLLPGDGRGEDSRIYRTGDLARYRPDGAIEYLGRIDHQVKIRGFRIELGEIEARLKQHPAVVEAVVLAREDNPGDRRLVAYLVPSSNGQGDTSSAHLDESLDRRADKRSASTKKPILFAESADAYPAYDLKAFLEATLPDYMVPAAFVFMERLPVTANGKLDRKALPVPDMGQRFSDRYVAPRNAAETSLAEIWAELLHLEQVGIHDNFFELGGDSILAIQAASRARAAGIAFTPRQLFEHQSIAELAAAAGRTEQLVGDDQAMVGGDVPLTPIQHWFFRQNFANVHHWNQAILLEVRDKLEPTTVERATEHLLLHHDALRLRFEREGGVWRQRYAEAEAREVFQRVDLSHVLEAERTAAIEAACSRVQASLDLSNGPLLRMVWFDLGKRYSPRLFIVVHHLAVDGVSWRILLEDLAQVCEQLSSGGPVELPAKTTSFKKWAERLQALVGRGALQGEQDYWLELAGTAVTALPVDDRAGPRHEGDAATCKVQLNEADTGALLREAPAAYRTGVEQLLLAALAQTLRTWCRSDTVVIDREGHGREPLFDDVDLSRTVGWFTSLYPVTLRLPEIASAGDLIKAVKEQLSNVPNNGIGYGLLRYAESSEVSGQLQDRSGAPVLFNYLGQFDQAMNGAPWRFAEEQPGISRGPDNSRPYELEIDAHVSEGCLQVAWRYSTGRCRRETVEELARRFVDTLREVIAHCLSPQAGGLTPGDFPLAGLSQDVLDRLPYNFREIEEIYPLSPMQEGMLFDTLMAPGSGIYVMQDRFELRGLVDEDVLRCAWQRIVDRHDALRTSFLWEVADRPRQVVHRHVELPFEYHDWRTLSVVEQEERLEALLAEERRRGFDFRKPPLMTIRLFRLGDDRYRLVRSFHHILIDAWCMSLMLVELRDTYEALCRGDIQHRERPPQFREYIRWLQGSDDGSAEAFWRKCLEGFSAATPLNVERSRGVGEEKDQSVGDAIAFLTREETEQLGALAQRLRLTPNTFVQAAWALMLSRYSGREDVLFGVTVSGRPAELTASERMLGVFINTLPLRVAAPADQSLPDFLHGLLRRNLELRQYEHVPLVSIQGWSELPREQPLFESLLVFENYPVDYSLRDGKGRFRIVGVDTRTHTNYPLTGMVIPGERLHLQITYYRNRFDDVVAERMLSHFRNLLLDMIRSPEKRLDELEMLSEQERRQILVDWNRTDRHYPGAATFAARFAEQVERTPEAPAVVCGDVSLTYRELNLHAQRMAGALVERGIGPESIVVLLAERGVDFLAALLAIFKAGGVYLPLDPSHPDARLAQVLNASGAALVIADESYAQTLREAASGASTVVTPAALLSEGCAGRPDGARANPHRLAYIIHTSGSTGEPKGVMVEQAGMLNNLLTKIPTLGLGEGDVIAQTASQSFDISVWQFLTALICGAEVAIYPDETAHDPKALLEAVARDGVTVLESVPALIRAMVDGPKIDLPRLRWLLPTGEAFPTDLCRRWMERYPHVRLLNAYGPAECSDDVAYHPISAKPAAGASSIPIGRPVDNLRLYVLDRRMRPVPVGIPGELCIAGVGVGRGYLNRPDLTAAAFVPDPFAKAPGERLYRSGDLGRFRPDGSVEFMGRIDHQVKIRGHRIELGEIEARLLQHRRVRDAVAMVQETRPGDRRLVAYVVRLDGEVAPSSLVEDLRAYLREALPGYMVPAAFVVLESLPLTPNGKVDRKNLPAPNLTDAAASALAPPRNRTEEILIGLWKEVLETDRVGIHDNFFELGGHSLVAIQLVGKLRAAFDVELPLRTLFETPTVAELGERIGLILLTRLESLTEEEASALLAQASDGRDASDELITQTATD